MDHFIVNGGVRCLDDVPVEDHLTLPVTVPPLGLEVADDLTCLHNPNHLGITLCFFLHVYQEDSDWELLPSHLSICCP